MLFEPIEIGSMHLKNRIVMAPMRTNFEIKNYVSRRLVAWYAERARGGVGMIITSQASVHPEEVARSREWTVSDDECILKLKKLTDAVHSNGARVVAQIGLVGRKVKPKKISAYPVAASSIASTLIGAWSIPRALTIEEIQDREKAFAEGARRVKEAGFDGVQLQAAHGYLIWSFLSPIANKRNDAYGNGKEGRVRFLVEIVKLVREKVGYDFPIIVRINGSDYVEGGITVDDAKFYAQKLEQNDVDAISISAAETSRLFPGEYMVPPRAISRGCNVHLSSQIRKVISIPTSVAGRIDSPDLSEKILQEEKADLVEMGRALIADPQLPNKAAENRTDEIRPCIACNRCEDIIEIGLPIQCTVNALAGRESKYKIKSTRKRKLVLIAGGGPAGMEAARVASLRGHNVILCEKEFELGGQLRISAVPPHKEEMKDLAEWFRTLLNKLEVKIELGQEVTSEFIKKMRPDVAIIATGALPFIPSTLNLKLHKAATANDVLACKVDVGENVVVVGGGFVGCETADLLSNRGKKVTIIEMLEDLGLLLDKVKGMNEMLLLRRLCEKGVRIFTNTKVEALTQKGVIVNLKGNMRTIEADTVVLAIGAKSNRPFSNELNNGTKIYDVGDCKRPRKLVNAINEGFMVARKV